MSNPAQRDGPIPGITGQLIADPRKTRGHKNVIYVPNFNDILSRCPEHAYNRTT